MPPLISIIIPTFSEENELPQTLRTLSILKQHCEIIIVDGGSLDKTVKIARKQGVRILTCSKRQRAAQMNAGANSARGSYLLFLHADTRMPCQTQRNLLHAIRGGRLQAAAFQRRFRSQSLFLALTCRAADCRTLLFGLALGDQGLLISRKLFFKLNGYREIDSFEDADLSLRLRRLEKLRLIRPPVQTSARRFRSYGPIWQTLSDFWLTLGFLLNRQRSNR